MVLNSTIHEYFEKNRDKHLEELTEFLSIPSISSLSEHKDDVKKGAEWVASSLEKLGMDNVKVYPTKGHPVVYGESLKAEGKPTVLVYGHYDVQPVDPLRLWDSEPFKAEIRDNKLYARGASDDKGQVFMHLKTIEALLETQGELPVNFKFLIEGEEEIGSPNLPAFIEEYKDMLNTDIVVISDTGMLDKGKPAVCYGLRGLSGLQIDVKGPKGDLHSGLYGGAVQNPLHAISEIIASFHDEHGKVTVEGFYDRVIPLTDDERKAFADLNDDEEAKKREIGVTELFGEEGFTAIERTWARPTLEINGLFGGFQGEGIKTVLPSEASAKITCRLVPDQDPAEIAELLQQHILKHKPKGVEVEFTLFDQGPPFVTPFDHPAIQAAGRAYEAIYEVPTAFTRGGGSIPIVASMDTILKVPVVLMGFGLATENFHAPNEHFHLENFDQGMRVLAYYWNELDASLSK
jgi:acetylornithine deacetylase/succinyl-diaminopimelate desuccinylase-like protein